ncbi:hypothetical protein ACIQU8_06125 [Streptomyces griseus]|uniref:hypothetical protein n=1 Tax=Streptomyces griseus TaxID=1911 RepID=UPI00382077DD
MSTTETSTKAPPDTPPESGVLASVDGPDGQSVPIEITLSQQPADSTGPMPGQEGVGRLRAWPVALFGTEAATTGASAAYAAAGTAGVLAAAGVAAGGGLIAAGVAAYRSRTTSPKRPGGRVLRPSGPRTTSNALSGRGRSGGRGSGAGMGTGGGRGHRAGGRGRSSGLGAVSSGVSSPRSGSRPSSVSSASPTRTSPVLNRTNKRTGNSGAGAGGFAGRSPSGPGTGSGGKGGLLRRLSQRRNGAGGAGSGSLAKDHGPGGGRGGGPGRSTVGAWTRRAARSGMRALAKTMGAGRAARDSAAGRALSDRIRTGRRSLVKKGKAGVRYVLRSAAAKVAAGAVGALALVPGLLLRTGAAVMGGLLRLLRLAPRTGTKWGICFTRWSLHLAKKVHTRLMAKAKKQLVAETRPDVMTDFDEPGHTRPLTDGPFGADYFGGNLVSVFQTETEAVREAYAAYDPPMMLAVAAEYWGLPEGVTSVAEAVRQLAVNTADKYPADAKMADQVAAVYALLHQAAQKAAEVGPLFAKVHENDLRRYEEPRPGEHMWNILERRPDGGFDQREPSRFVAVAQDVAHVYSRYEPGHMNQVAAEYEGIPAGIENIAAAISLLQVRSNDRYPVDKAVVDAITDVHQLLMQAASAAQELMPSFRRLHAPDIARHEAPRNGEESEAMWDV